MVDSLSRLRIDITYMFVLHNLSLIDVELIDTLCDLLYGELIVLFLLFCFWGIRLVSLLFPVKDRRAWPLRLISW